MGGAEVERFLSTLATEGQVAASMQNQALSALLFLYREVLAQDLPWMNNIRRAKRPERLPTVLTRDEVAALLAEMSGVTWLMVGLLYGAGLRSMECLRLRVQDIDFARREIMVRQGKGGKDQRPRRRHATRRAGRVGLTDSALVAILGDVNPVVCSPSIAPCHGGAEDHKRER